MTNSEEDSPSLSNASEENSSKHLSIPEPEDKVVGKKESWVLDKDFEKDKHEKEYWLDPSAVAHIWRNGIKKICSDQLEWQGFQQYISNNHQEDVANFAEDSISWDQLVQRIEDGIRDKFD